MHNIIIRSLLFNKEPLRPINLNNNNNKTYLNMGPLDTKDFFNSKPIPKEEEEKKSRIWGLLGVLTAIL